MKSSLMLSLPLARRRALVGIFGILGAVSTLAVDPVITNVIAQQRAGTKLVDITYDLAYSGDKNVEVAVTISENGGATFAVPAETLSGAVNRSAAILPGTGLSIVWNAGVDWNQRFTPNAMIRLQAAEWEPQAAAGEFVLIPAGNFTMGRTSGDTDSDAPPVTVYVSGFYMAKHEVTKALWDEVRAWGLSNDYTDLRVGGGKAAEHPVQAITWHDAVKWCNARSQKEGLNPCYTRSGSVYKSGASRPTCDWSTNGYRLPTEAEWEKAARGDVSGKRFPWGDTISHSEANYYVLATDGMTNDYIYDVSLTRGWNPSVLTLVYSGQPYTSPVGSFNGSGFGLYDIAGNVREWCWDLYSNSYYSDQASDPRGPSMEVGQVVRGGSWGPDASDCRASDRGNLAAGAPYNTVGFRLARSLVP